MEMQRIAVYIRVGADSSVSDKTAYYAALIGQRDDCELVGFYVDKGTSGRDNTRPEYTRMLTDAQSRKFDYIVVQSLAKFSRDTSAAIKAIDELRKRGIGLYTIDEKIDTLDENYGTYRAMITTLLAFKAQ